MGLAGWEGMVMYSTLSKIARTALTFSRSVAKIEGWVRRMLIASEAAVAKSGGMAAENTKDVPLIR